MHPILVLFSHHAEKNGLRNGEVVSCKLAGPKNECTEEMGDFPGKGSRNKQVSEIEFF